VIALVEPMKSLKAKAIASFGMHYPIEDDEITVGDPVHLSSKGYLKKCLFPVAQNQPWE
jgi:hypothetical protein